MLLAIDAGNTNVTFGLFDGERLAAEWRIRTEAGRTADEYAALLRPLLADADFSRNDIDGVALASVVPDATPDLIRLAEKTFGVDALRVTGALDLGLEIAYEPPEAVGADRLADAVAAAHRFGSPCIVIDFGTATTFNAVQKPTFSGGRPVYLGGAICLGIGVSLDALYSRAAKLSPVELAAPKAAIGRSTAHALQSGIVFGYAAQVAVLVALFRDEMGAPDCPVVATGGHAALIAGESPVITSVVPTLTLDGLRLIYQRCIPPKNSPPKDPTA